MTASNILDRVELNNGIKMPWLGLGVFQTANGAEVEDSVTYALETGYRSIDTASIYGNEDGVGKAIKNSKIARENIFLTSKLWNSDLGYDSTIIAFEESLKKLQTDYLDLYLIHWPVEGKYLDSWKAIEKLYNEKLIKVIGVSNFMIHHLKDLIANSTVIPAINQIEFHPFLTQPELINYCQDQKIQVEAWSPIMKGTAGDVPEIVLLSEKYNKTPTQIVLRYDLQKKIITIPKSVNKKRIIENSQIFDFHLDELDIKKIDSLNKNFRFGADPDNFDF